MRQATKRYILSVVALGAMALAAGHARADVAVTLDNTTGQSLGNGPFTLGYQFTTNQAISVTSLGIFDDSQDGLVESHDVGIFDSNGNLVASTTVQAGTVDPLVNQFRYASIAPVTLAAGQTYNIGAVFLDGLDPNIFPGGAINFATSPAINFVQNGYAGGSTLSNPVNTTGTAPAYFGPNFQFTAAAVPEPSTLALAALGALGLVGARLRRYSQAV